MKIEIIAHRGAGQGFVQPDTPPENTLPAFAYAWSREVNADAAEADIHLTSDGEIVVIHDATTQRTANASWVVAEHTLAALRRLDAGSWKAPQFAGTRLPTLEEVIETIPEGKRLFTEIKTGPEITGRLAQVVRRSGKKPSQLPIISFNIDSIRRAKEMLPEHECYLLVSFEGPGSQAVTGPAGSLGLDIRTGLDTRLELDSRTGLDIRTGRDSLSELDALMELVEQSGLDGIDISQAHPPSLRSRIRERQMKAVVWTVNDAATARQMLADGIGSITTDVPKQMRAVLLG
jgi:glycerophosphoryl diester phosphodiesterase